jgi:hypothetical protein
MTGNTHITANATPHRRYLPRLAGRVRAFAVAAALLTPAAYQDPSPQELAQSTTPALQVFTGGPQRLAQGATTLYTVTIDRTAFTGPVSLSAAPEGVLPGVTVEFDPQTLAPGVTQTTARVSASATAPVAYVSEPPVSLIPITATGPGSLRATTQLLVQLVPSSLVGITLNATPGSHSIRPSEAAEGLVTIARQGNYTGALTVTMKALLNSAMTGTLTPVAGVPDTWRFRSTVTDIDKLLSITTILSGAYFETYDVTATGPGISTVTTRISVSVVIPRFQPFVRDRPRLLPGESITLPVPLQRENRFPDAIQMSLEGAPPGITATFTPNPAPDDASAMTVRVASTVAPGFYPMTVRGTLGADWNGMSRSSDFGITVVDPVPRPTYTLDVPPVFVAAGSDASSVVRVTRDGGFTGPVAVSLATANGASLPPGMTVTLAQRSINGASTGVSVTTTAATPPGAYEMLATGSATGAPANTARFTITVLTPNFSLSVPDVTVEAGATANASIGLTRAPGTPSNLAVGIDIARVDGAALPAGMRLVVAPAIITGASTTVQVITTTATPVGSYALRVTGQSTTFGAVTTRFTVVVTAAPPPSAVARVVIEPGNAEITAPAIQQYTATLYNASGAVITPESGGAIVWNTSNRDYAAINPTGVAVGVSAGPATITAKYVRNGVDITQASTPLTVYANGSPGHYGSATLSTQGNARTLSRGASLLVQVIVRDVNGQQVTAGVSPAPTLTSSAPGVISVVPTNGPVAGYFFTLNASASAAVGTEVRLRYDVMGAGGEVVIRVVP